MLINEDIHVDFDDKAGNTPLMLSVTQCNGYAIKKLLAKGANPNHQNKLGRTPFHIAAGLGESAVINEFSRFCEYHDVVDIFGFSPLHVAAGLYNIPIVRLLCSLGGDIGRRDLYGRSIYFWSSMCEPSIFRDNPSFTPPVELKSWEWRAHLRQKVKDITTSILEDTGPEAYSHYHYLGKCLAFLGNDEAAIVAFEQRVIRLSHGAVCDVCDESIVGVRWCCVHCQDMDFCDEHYMDYKSKEMRVRGCYKHKFLKIPRDIFPSLQQGIVNQEGLTLSAWLSALWEDPDASP